MSYVIKKKVSVEEEYTTVDVDTATDDVETRLNISNTINEVNNATTTIENLSELEEETIQKLEEAEEKIQNGEIDSVDVVDMECFKQKMELIMGVKLSGPTIALEDARNNPKEQLVLCTEGIKNALKSIWESIKKIFKWIGDKIKQFINWLKGESNTEDYDLKRLQAKADALKQDIAKRKKEAGSKWFSKVYDYNELDTELIGAIENDPLKQKMDTMNDLMLVNAMFDGNDKVRYAKDPSKVAEALDRNKRHIDKQVEDIYKEIDEKGFVSLSNNDKLIVIKIKDLIATTKDGFEIIQKLKNNIKAYNEVYLKFYFKYTDLYKELFNEIQKNKSGAYTDKIYNILKNICKERETLITELEKKIFNNSPKDYHINGVKYTATTNFSNAFITDIEYEQDKDNAYIVTQRYNYRLLNKVEKEIEVDGYDTIKTLDIVYENKTAEEKVDVKNLDIDIWEYNKRANNGEYSVDSVLVGYIEDLKEQDDKFLKYCSDPMRQLIEGKSDISEIDNMISPAMKSYIAFGARDILKEITNVATTTMSHVYKNKNRHTNVLKYTQHLISEIQKIYNI